MEFTSLYSHGFARVAACTPSVALGEPDTNAERIVEQVRQCHDDGVALALFPELSVSGYSLDDLLLQDVLLDAVDAAIVKIAEETADLMPLVVVGAPIANDRRLYNCAVVIQRGNILGVVPKSYLPNYREFYEKRHFAEAAGADLAPLIRPHWPTAVDDPEIPFGTDLIFEAADVPGLKVFVEICEDMWVPMPPSTRAALAGATVVANLSASPITIGRAEDRALMVRSQSARCQVAYIYSAASLGESSTDLSWDGQSMIYEAGDELAQSERFLPEASLLVADIDLDRLAQERLRQGSMDDNARAVGVDGFAFTPILFELDPPTTELGLRRPLNRFPFVPDDPARLNQDCYEAYNIQVSALERRMLSMSGGVAEKAPKIVIGVSGGLDSTHALIVAAKACDRLGLPRTHILAFTLPGFASSSHTKNNATLLSEALGVTFETVDIRQMAEALLKALGHPAGDGEPVYDVTYENVQAGLRTDFLFRAANQRGGFVLGTGDLSELALGWCTYGVGDQMSHYGVNAGVPKTLMQHLIRWVISSGQFPEDGVNETLDSILNTEISPELIPVADGAKPQSTQDSIGPYALHDFTLFGVLRRGYRPSKIAFLEWHAWRDAAVGDWPAGYPEDDHTAYDLATIKKWMAVFLKRFFGNQFKRTAMPNGPKVLAGGSLSPRGDWRMPSDASARVWLDDLEANVPDAG
ncbi:NAD(+) synthase [Tessaracoccus flavescens]|uniref:Glutamine-dependent NAD(+) synthetase n=1 Tax=Tessaracoccus flavescens TaxID=399497 RepID=A0A1Q2CYE4_9ACTN|nr:NAD(+) synthase [Tessaracoccus flavescens]AQP51054.1 NAD(+) synthase [Tessaracoccus flavescens]